VRARPAPLHRRLVACAVALGLAGAGCGAGDSASLAIAFRVPVPDDPTLLDGVDNFLFSVSDARDRVLVLRRSPASAGGLRLDDIPFGPGLVFSLQGLYGDTAIVAGRTCPTDVLQGDNLPALSMFVARVGTFSSTQAMPADVGDRPLVLSGSGGVLVAGGAAAAGGQPTADAQAYDARTGRWAQAASPLDGPRAAAAIATLSDGSQIVVGGLGMDGVPVASAALYREGEGLREIASSAALGLIDAAVAALPGGQALVAGGQPGAGAGATAAAWLYDGTSLSLPLRPVVPMLAARSAHTLSVVGSAGFAAGFAIGGNGADGTPRDDIELYNPGSASVPATFRAVTARMASPRAGHTATVLPTGEILIVAGAGPSGLLRTAELFDPISTALRPAGTLIDARQRHQATLLGDGRVLVTGGLGEAGTALASAEIFDPQIGSFVAARPLRAARAGHVAVVVCDGTVLLVGGGPGAELYNPPR
jgi:hypothetical protein